MKCTLYFMTNICEMQGRAGGKYLTVDTSHSPQWQSATSQGCPWPWRRGNAFWIKVENNGCCSFVHLCANAMLLGRIDLSLSPAPDWRANVYFSAICNRFALKCILLDHQWPALCSKNILLKSNKVRSQEFIKTSSWHIEIHCLRILIFCVQGMRSFQNAACGLWSKHGVLYANQSSQIHVNQETIGMSPAWDKYSTRHIKVEPIKN